MNTIAARARTLLFLPANRLDRLSKALDSGAHMVVLELEDALAPTAKPVAREALREHWSQLEADSRARIALRINAAATRWHADDAALACALADQGLGALMLAKTESLAQLGTLARAVGPVPLLPLVESAEGLAELDLIARAPGVVRLVFGHLDFQVDLGMQCEDDEREIDPVRLVFVTTSRRAGLPGPVDGVTINLKDTNQVRLDTQRSRRFGFTGKLCIHPTQVSVVNDTLGPTPEQLDWARRVLAAADAQQADVFQFEGAMVDTPILARAHRYLQLTF